MTLTHDQALQQLHAWTTNPSLLGHARAVEIVMRAAAAKYGGTPTPRSGASPACSTTPTTTNGPRSIPSGSWTGSGAGRGGNRLCRFLPPDAWACRRRR